LDHLEQAGQWAQGYKRGLLLGVPLENGMMLMTRKWLVNRMGSYWL
jgi:hypothetical protein